VRNLFENRLTSIPADQLERGHHGGSGSGRSSGGGGD
jgi:hypothetical protein